ncbi:uncharacterized protein CBL_02179 [Carabus blaptoides fortunei]
MYDSPISLQELCVEIICCNLDEVFDQYYDDSDVTSVLNVTGSDVARQECHEPMLERDKKYRFKQSDLFLFNVISEQLLVKLGEKKLLTDSTISLFTQKNTRLRSVTLINADTLTVRGLKVLKGHKVVELQCCGLKIPVNDIIACLSEWSLENLRLLNISRCICTDSSRFSVVVALSKLRNLRALNVSYTEFTQHGLRLVCDDLKKLEKIDISCTLVMDMSPLTAAKHKLTSLTVSNFNHIKARNFISTLLELNNLKYLDISSEKDEPTPELFFSHVTELLVYNDALPNLTFLDLSGKITIDPDILVTFIKNHKHLTFLGLVHCQVCYEDVFTNEKHPDYKENLVVAGTATEKQIQVALKRYSDRAIYVQKCLYYLFRMTPYFKDARPDIIDLVLPGMRLHPSQFGVQMAATACLYNLTKGELSLRIHPNLLKQVVSLTLTAMKTFPNHYQLQKNSLLTLCSDRILQDVSFNKFHCAKLVMDSLCAFDDQSMNRMAVAICSILAAKITTAETSQLGSNPLYMKKLLSMVENKVSQVQVDITMKFTLSALWNLTDESAKTCKVFLDEGGIELFLQVLDTFPSDSTVETKVLGLINNIAEVCKLRKQLMINKFIEQLKGLLHSVHIDVSYFAAGIISHLASDGDAAWSVTNITRQEMLHELGEVVSKWDIPDGEMVAYRSFYPFFPLLKCPMDYPIQLWAVWAIHHVCTKNPKRYCFMLISEGGTTLLHQIIANEYTHPNIKHFASLVIGVLHNENIAHTSS